MKFSFSKKYRFSCKKCGACCKQKSISITDKEVEWLKKEITPEEYELVDTYNFYDVIVHEVQFNGDSCFFNMNAGHQNLCKEYDSRFINCLIYPLTFSVLPDGELLVNILHCNGVSLEQGELVDEEFVKKIIQKVNQTDESYLDNYLTFQKDNFDRLMPFFGYQDFAEYSTKRFFMNKLSQWITQDYSRYIPIDTRICAIEEIVAEVIIGQLTQLARKINTGSWMLVTAVDAENFASEIEKEIERKITGKCEEIEVFKQKHIEKELSEGRVEFDGAQDHEILGIADKMTFNTPYLEKIDVIVKDVIKEKVLSTDANHLLTDYIIEICSRVGRGGFMPTVPLCVILPTLTRFSRSILEYARVYSQENEVVEKEHIDDAITFIDSRVRIGDIQLMIENST